MILEQESIDVFFGLDVGKTGHHAVALNRAGRKLYDKALPQDETKIRDIVTKLTGRGKVHVVVDQPATIGALPVAVAQATGAAVGYLPGLAMRRIADLPCAEDPLNRDSEQAQRALFDHAVWLRCKHRRGTAWYSRKDPSGLWP